MALWNETKTPAPGTLGTPSAVAAAPERPVTPPEAAAAVPVRRPPPQPHPQARAEGGESVIAANLTIEGKIEGSGSVRIAGKFKGDVRIDGNFTIEAGAHLTGQVIAAVVLVAGELQGNIESAKRVDVMEGGVI